VVVGGSFGTGAESGEQVVAPMFESLDLEEQLSAFSFTREMIQERGR